MPDKNLIDYFINETNQKFEKLEAKVDQILQFKWQIVGGSVVLSVLVTLAIQLGIVIFKGG
jgi:hypothetical protein